MGVATAFLEELEMEQLSNKIRRLRFDAGEMTQKALAEQVGISRQTMNAIENGRHAPTISVAIRIADVFQVSVDQLFTLDYEGRPARPERPARVAVDHPQGPVKEPVDEPVEIRHQALPAEKEPDQEDPFVDLRALIGP